MDVYISLDRLLLRRIVLRQLSWQRGLNLTHTP